MIKNQIIAEFVQVLVEVIFMTVIFFSSLRLGKVGSDLGFYDDIIVDLDVFLYEVCEILGGWTKSNGKCSFFSRI